MNLSSWRHATGRYPFSSPFFPEPFLRLQPSMSGLSASGQVLGRTGFPQGQEVSLTSPPFYMRRRQVHLIHTGPLRPERCGHPPGFDTRCFPTIDLHSHALPDCAVDSPAGSCLSPTSRTREALRHLRPVSLAHATRLIARRAGAPHAQATHPKSASMPCGLLRSSFRSAYAFAASTPSSSIHKGTTGRIPVRPTTAFKKESPAEPPCIPVRTDCGPSARPRFSQLRAGAAHPKGCQLLFIDPMTIASLSQHSWNKRLVIRTRYLSRRLNPPRAVPPNAVPQRQT